MFLIVNIMLDELGFKKIPAYSADDFFEVISKRYEKGFVIITTNKTFKSWGVLQCKQDYVQSSIGY